MKTNCKKLLLRCFFMCGTKAFFTVSAVAAGLSAWLFLGGSDTPQTAENVEIKCRNGDVIHFRRISGDSELPLDYLCVNPDPAGKTRLVPVSIPAFWMADEMVTEGLFADVTGSDIRAGRDGGSILTDVEWEDAFMFCRKFTEQYSGQMPNGCFATLPTNIEWAHAMNVLGSPKPILESPVGSFLFIGNDKGGYLHTLGSFIRDFPNAGEDLDAAIDFARICKRQTRAFVGIRLVLVDWTGGQISSRGEPVDNGNVSRGVVLLQHGLFDEASAMLESAVRRGKLSSNERKRAKDAIKHGKKHREFDIEDWGGLVKRAMAHADRRGYVTAPFAGLWGGEDAVIPSDGLPEYDAAGICGKWMRIGDLPQEVRCEQNVGQNYTYLIGDPPERREYTISDDTRVQVLECDFSGDGRTDLVVESFGSAASAGAWYDFFEALPDGSFSSIGSQQVVGLCAIPRKNGGACGFITVGKESNPVLYLGLLSVRKGEFVYEPIGGKSVYMSDAADDEIYVRAPFIGCGYGMGFMILEGRFGVFSRPLFWVWEPGFVQGVQNPL